MDVIIAFVLLTIALLMGVPVMYAFTVGTLFLVAYHGMDPSFIINTAYGKVNSIILLVIPLFVVCGALMERGKLGKALVDLVSKFVGHVKAGMAMVSIVACALFGALTGSGVATLTCIGGILTPELKKKGYPPGHIAALFANCAPLGFLIPPSSIQLLYAWTTGQSVLSCFLAVLIPGIILTFLLCVTNYFMLRNNKNIIQEPKESFKEWRLDTVKKTGVAIPALLLPVFILGSIYSGMVTVTESAAIATVYAAFAGIVIYKALTWKSFKGAVIKGAESTGSIMALLFLSMVLSQLLTRLGVGEMLRDAIIKVSDNPVAILIMVNIFLVIIGMLMDDMSGLVLCVPMLMPLMEQVGVNPIQFAAIIGVNLGMANVTPPTAPLLYVASKTCGAEIAHMLKPTIIMLIFAWLPTLILTTYIPALSTWLPELVMGPKYVLM